MWWHWREQTIIFRDTANPGMIAWWFMVNTWERGTTEEWSCDGCRVRSLKHLVPRSQGWAWHLKWVWNSVRWQEWREEGARSRISFVCLAKEFAFCLESNEQPLKDSYKWDLNRLVSVRFKSLRQYCEKWLGKSEIAGTTYSETNNYNVRVIGREREPFWGYLGYPIVRTESMSKYGSELLERHPGCRQVIFIQLSDCWCDLAREAA